MPRRIVIGLVPPLLSLIVVVLFVLSASDTSPFRMLVLKSEEDLKRTTDFRICATYRWRAVYTGATPAITKEVNGRNLDCSVLPLGPTTYLHPPVRIPKLQESNPAREPVEERIPSAKRSRGGQSGNKSKLFAVQELLKLKGLYKGKVDGIYGPATKAALKVFRAQNGWSGTDEINFATGDKNRDSANLGDTAATKPETISQGRRSNISRYQTQLIWAQEFLKFKGLYKGKLDGIYGPSTNAALITFQARHGLENTGEINFSTIDRMREVDSR